MRFIQHLEKQTELRSLLVGHWLIDLANFSAFVWREIPDLNWAGFYLRSEGRLILGPFQGKTACTFIPEGKGVCGASFTQQKALIVPDVHLFPGHIACDEASRSEMVLPLIKDGDCWGVFDLDSPIANRFAKADQADLEKALEILLDALPSSQLRKNPWNAL